MLGDFITRILLLLFGYAYPAFECFKSVEKNKIQIDELRFWCQYWIIIALLTVLERVGDTFISWMPMYGEVKLGFFIYLWYPKTKGTGYIYEILLRPLVAKHEKDIDTKLMELRVRAWDFGLHYWQNCTKLGQSTFFQMLDYLASQSGKVNNNKKDENYEPMSRSPPSSLHEAPSMSKHKNSKWPPAAKANRAVSGSPKSTHVQHRLDEQTEYLHTVVDDDEAEVVNDLQHARTRLRRSNPVN